MATSSPLQGRLVRRDHAAPQPAGVRALAPVADARRHLRRRRSERRGQPRAVRPRQPLRDPAAGARDRRCVRPRACARKACTRTTSCAAATASASTSPRRAPASARRRSSTTARTRRSARWRPTPSTGTRCWTGAPWFHVTGITPALGDKGAAATAKSIAAAQRAGAKVSVDLNFRKKLWTESAGPGSDAAADERRRCGDRQRRRPAVGARRARGRRRRHERQLDVEGLPRRGGARDARLSARRWSRSRCAKASPRATTAGARSSGTASSQTLHQSQRYDVRLVDRIGGGDSFAAGLIYGLVTGRSHAGRPALRRRGERAEADDSG